ncbi:hypothetical protein E8E13_001612 [Curvularia kusanoi]|uniref:Uncharacterized protein n=1 Tax=Curvularia kusanoi TaxID=90978 RepID=A0A9P4T4D7_CURKU|nr:hypothetical protein E8E13_001612 [Curvularia kusanoi]
MSDASVCHLASLPDELLVAIASELRIERGFLNDTDAEERRVSNNAITTRSLSALVLTCRKFNAIATPLFYQCVIRPPQTRSRNLLFRTLINNPALGQHVHYLELDEDNRYMPDPRKEFQGLDAVKLGRLMLRAKWLIWSPDSTEPVVDIGNTIYSTSGSIESEYTKRQRKAVYANPLDLLVFMMDNLQEAALPARLSSHLSFRHTEHDKLRRVWLGNAKRPSERTCRVPIVLSGTEGNLSVYLRGYPITANPRMAISPFLGEHEPRTLAPMTEMVLSIYEGNPEYMDILLAECASLERFSIRWFWTDLPVQDFPVDLPSLRESLCQVQDSLTHLTIDPSESAWRVGMDEIVPSMGSLRNFKALKYLEVTEIVLWDDDESADPPPLSAILPPSLETLLIIKTEWDDDIGDALYQLGVDIPAFFPHLQTVECTWRPAPEPVAEELMKLFKASGVDLQLSIEDDIDSHASGS